MTIKLDAELLEHVDKQITEFAKKKGASYQEVLIMEYELLKILIRKEFDTDLWPEEMKA